MTDFYEKITKAASEGAVLLKNEGDTLPLQKGENVAVFGRCQIDYYKSGTGSGGSVHVPFSINLIDGFKKMKDAGENVPSIDSDLVKIYRDWIVENPFDNGNGGWASEPWFQKEMPLSDELVEKAAQKSKKALYVIGRTAGEDQDNHAEKGSYYLTDEERACLLSLTARFEKVVVVLNVPNVIDLSWISDAAFRNHITAIIFTWQGGMTGGLGAARVLCGAVNPSGRLTDTIAKTLEDYPSTRNFGSATDEIYAEDIFVGYRYFSTFDKESVLYPFGFGLSYTTFETSATLCKKDGVFCVKAVVKNTGKKRGREVVQVYAECPQGALGKASRVLCAFGKTGEIEAGASGTIEMKFGDYELSSFDDSGKTGFAHSYVLEEGEYHFFAGKNVFDAKEIFLDGGKTYREEKTRVIEKLSENLAPFTPFERFAVGEKKGGVYVLSKETVPLSKISVAEKMKALEPISLDFTGDKGIKFADVCRDKSKIDAFISQFTDEELCSLVRGEGMMSRKVATGIASALGGLSERLHDHFGIPAVGCSDGPSGLRRDNGLEASLVPIGTLLACSWDIALVEDVYEGLGAEMAESKIDVLLGPGCNIHRNPLNGRNFEYFSEDPLLSGKMAAAIVRGLHKNGAQGTIKHFALNNQETHRRDENSVASARAIREIYLKPFEIAVKEGGAKSIMTSYNGVNSHWTASNFELCTGILRSEWGFSGMVMTDWWAGMNDNEKGGVPSVRKLSFMVKARNDIYMVVPNDSAEKGGFGDDLEKTLASGELKKGYLQQAVKDIVLFVTDTLAAKNPLRPLKNEIVLESKLDKVPEGAVLHAVGEKIAVDGKTMYFNVEKSGDYNVSGFICKDGGETLSQSITNVLINAQNCGSFECRSTDGKTIQASAVQLKLEKGVYALDLEHTKPGITVSEMIILSEGESPSPVTAGFLS